MHNLTAGGDALRISLKSNFEGKYVNELCDTTDDGLCCVHIFSEAKDLNPYLGPLWAISRKHQSDIFRMLWKSQIESSWTLTPMTLVEVINVIWYPVLKLCTEIVQELFSWAIKLDQVDRIFKRYSVDENILACEIRSLYRAVQECHGESATDLKWIETRITKMQQYWELCSYQDAVVAFCKIKDSLKLTGDFTLVETVAAKVFISLGYNTQPVVAIIHMNIWFVLIVEEEAALFNYIA